MFRTGAMRESEEGIVRLQDYSVDMVTKMLEFIYTNRVADIGRLSSSVGAEIRKKDGYHTT